MAAAQRDRPVPDDANLRIFQEFFEELVKFRVNLQFGSQSAVFPSFDRAEAIAAQLFDHFDTDHDGIWQLADAQRFVACRQFLRSQTTFDWMYFDEVERVSRAQGKGAEETEKRLEAIKHRLNNDPIRRPDISAVFKSAMSGDFSRVVVTLAARLIRTMRLGALGLAFCGYNEETDQSKAGNSGSQEEESTDSASDATHLSREHFVDQYMVELLTSNHLSLVGQGVVPDFSRHPHFTRARQPPPEVACFRTCVDTLVHRIIAAHFDSNLAPPYAFTDDECKQLLQPVFEVFDTDNDGKIGVPAFSSLCESYLQALCDYTPHYMRYHFVHGLNYATAMKPLRKFRAMSEWVDTTIPSLVKNVLTQAREMMQYTSKRVPELLQLMGVTHDQPVTLDIFLSRFAPNIHLNNDSAAEPESAMLSLFDPMVFNMASDPDSFFSAELVMPSLKVVSNALREGVLDEFDDLRANLADYYLSALKATQAAWRMHRAQQHQTLAVLRHLPADQLPDMLDSFELPANGTIDDVIREFKATSPLTSSLNDFCIVIPEMQKILHELDPEIAMPLNVSGGGAPQLVRPPSLVRTRSSEQTQAAVASLTQAIQTLGIAESSSSGASSSDEKGEEDDGESESDDGGESEIDHPHHAAVDASSNALADMELYMTLGFADRTNFLIDGEEGFHSHADEMKAVLARIFASLDKNQDGLLERDEQISLQNLFIQAIINVYRRQVLRCSLKLLRRSNPPGTLIETFLADSEQVFKFATSGDMTIAMKEKDDVKLAMLHLSVEVNENGQMSRQKVLSRWPDYPKQFITDILSMVMDCIKTHYSSIADDSFIVLLPILQHISDIVVHSSTPDAAGKLQQQFFRQRESLLRPIFECFDTDGDGFLNASEQAHLLEQWLAAQRSNMIAFLADAMNKKLHLAKASASTIASVRHGFERLAGPVSAEMSAAIADSSQFLPCIKKIDSNNDGLISLSEFLDGFVKHAPMPVLALLDAMGINFSK